MSTTPAAMTETERTQKHYRCPKCAHDTIELDGEGPTPGDRCVCIDQSSEDPWKLCGHVAYVIACEACCRCDWRHDAKKAT